MCGRAADRCASSSCTKSSPFTLVLHFTIKVYVDFFSCLQLALDFLLAHQSHRHIQLTAPGQRSQCSIVPALVWSCFDFIDFTKFDAAYKQSNATFFQAQPLSWLSFKWVNELRQPAGGQPCSQAKPAKVSVIENVIENQKGGCREEDSPFKLIFRINKFV